MSLLPLKKWEMLHLDDTIANANFGGNKPATVRLDFRLEPRVALLGP